MSGVNPDEELIKMLQFQQMYQASARYLIALSDLTLDLMRIVR